ncbi:tyrosine-type recombinase/integrase [Chloroflexi bacterium TSY]|nr:tyrosine-type recombinase/integrase [Chloroflexi bacterium TSY]
MIITLVDTGLRASELTELRIGHYNCRQGQIAILHGKCDKKRTFFLGTAGRRTLWRYLASRPDTSVNSPFFSTTIGLLRSKQNHPRRKK